MRILIGGLFFSRPLTGLAQDTNQAPLSHPLMHFTPEEMQRMMVAHLQAPQMSAQKDAEKDFAGSLSLLARLPYTPAERDQRHCGDCWQWAGTGVMEIAHDVQNGIHDRLSVQFINSCQTVRSCCAGGWLSDVATFYSSKGFAVPWTNNSAQFSSTNGSCASAPCANIATTPQYGITSISAVSITTHGVGQAQAIANIKSALNQNKAVCFSFYMSTTADWSQFETWWIALPESSLWSSFYCGQTADSGEAGHAVLCVGYNDDDPNNRYWIIVNSWGTTTGRPNGIFHVSMDLNYDCAYSSGGYTYYSLYWETLNMQYGSTVPSISVAATDATAGEPATGQGTGTFTFTRAGNAAGALTVNFTVGGTATSGSDYTALGTTVSFAAGATTATKTVSVQDDNLVEGDETVVVTLAAGTGYTVGSPSTATVTIKDDDATVTVQTSPSGRTFSVDGTNYSSSPGVWTLSGWTRDPGWRKSWGQWNRSASRAARSRAMI
jgi:C1A family cysteine protease